MGGREWESRADLRKGGVLPSRVWGSWSLACGRIDFICISGLGRVGLTCEAVVGRWRIGEWRSSGLVSLQLRQRHG